MDGAARFLQCLLLVLALPAAPLSAQIAQTAYVKASNTGEYDLFGYAVAISGNTMVVGAPDEDSGASGVNGNQASDILQDSGAAYVFVRGANGLWFQQAYLKPYAPVRYAKFGRSVAISGNLIAIGAPASVTEPGAVYLFTRTGSVWEETARLSSSNNEHGDFFGHAVALSGTTLVVGAPHEDSGTAGVDAHEAHNGAPSAGAAYVFVRGGNGQWYQQAYLKASNTHAQALFGTSVALDDSTVVVGAIGEKSLSPGVNSNQADQSGDNVGAAYVFNRVLSIWGQSAYLKAAQPANGQRFGFSVAVSGPVIACGSQNRQMNLFVRSSQGWTPDPTFPSALPETDSSDRVVALSGNKLLIGLPDDSSGGAGVRPSPMAPDGSLSSGAAFLFERTAHGWKRQAFLKAAHPGSIDYLGWSVALSEDTAVIGAFGEDSFTAGINGNPFDNTVTNSGAAYVFNIKGPFAEITSASRSGNSFITEFHGPPGLTEWKVMRSTDLHNFTIDKTAASTITELTAGRYRAVTDLTGAGSRFFLRIEHD